MKSLSLQALLGDEAISVAQEAVRLVTAGKKAQAIDLPKDYDRKIGGDGFPLPSPPIPGLQRHERNAMR